MDDEFQLVVENKLTANASDKELLGMLAGVQGQLGVAPEAVLADAGYRDEGCFAELERRQIDAYISLQRRRRARTTSIRNIVPPRGAWAKKLGTADGKARYAERKSIDEAINGWLNGCWDFGGSAFAGCEVPEANGIWCGWQPTFDGCSH